MLTRWFSTLILCVALSHSTVAVNAQTTLPHGSHIAGELLIAPRSGVSNGELESVYNGHGGQKIRTLSQINVHHIRVSESALDAIEAALRNNPKVASVEKNFVAQANLVPNDPNFVNQWFLQKVSAPSAWDLSTGSASLVVAVIDSGVDPLHSNLVAKLVPGFNFIGTASDMHDIVGHGTAVAVVIGADTNPGPATNLVKALSTSGSKTV
jgi:thermitase